MYKVILIDDEPLARQLLQSLLSAYPQFDIIAECGDGFEGFKAIQQHAPDLIFLDVQMPRLSGFEMLELLDEAPSVIFTTAFDQYAMDAFEAHAIDYLLKPLSRERFDKAIEKWLKTADTRPGIQALPALAESVAAGYAQRIVVKDRGAIRIIPANDILHIEAADDYVKIFTREGNFLKKATMGHIEASLDPAQFVRVHRSAIIPVGQIAKIEPYEKESHIARLQSGAKVPVSKAGMMKLKQVLGW
ncbi:MAG: response regulator [Bacteroidetes bacterium]|nr:response regulator [Bacteroidota bacterium]MBS1629640.1 response regulator [Bacteroidota bacterium]